MPSRFRRKEELVLVAAKEDAITVLGLEDTKMEVAGEETNLVGLL